MLADLQRPLVFLDLETTGPNHGTARIVQVGLIIYKPDGSVREWEEFVNPERPIPAEASYGDGKEYKGHGITDAMVANAKTFAELSENLYRGLSSSDVAGYNVKTFDVKVLKRQFKECGREWDTETLSVIDPYRLWQIRSRRNLETAVRELLGREQSAGHTALSDCRDARDLLQYFLDTDPSLPRTAAGLARYCFPPPKHAIDDLGKLVWSEWGEVVLTFGEHAGTPIQRVPWKYLQWIAGPKTTFSDTVKTIARNALNRIFPTREAAQPVCERPDSSDPSTPTSSTSAAPSNGS